MVYKGTQAPAPLRCSQAPSGSQRGAQTGCFRSRCLHDARSVNPRCSRSLAAVGVVAALAGTATRPNPSIIAVGNTTVPRFSHTATLLKSGKVLVAGGLSRGSEPQATTEIYDPETRRFSPIGSLISRRGYGSTATLLPSGKVLIAGGSCGSGCMLATAEIFDPANQQFRSTGSMSVPRAAAQDNQKFLYALTKGSQVFNDIRRSGSERLFKCPCSELSVLLN